MGSTGWSTSAGPGVDRRRRGRSDVAGIAVLGACAIWTLISATARAGRPEGVLLAVLAVAAGYAGGRIAGGLAPVATCGAVAAGGLALAVASPQTVPVPDSSAPLGGAGATAALLVLSTGALCCAAWSARTRRPRITLHLLSAGTVVVGVLAGSAAGAAASCAVALCSLASARRRRRARALAGLGVGTAVVAGLGLALADGALPPGWASFLTDGLSERRVRLWRRALELAEAHPALGTGPGRFEDVNGVPAPSEVPDARPHSAVLQTAAEQGFVGLALLTAAYGWLLYVLWRSTRPTPVVLTAGAALTAVAVLATLGNALSFTAVTAGAGLLAGIATAVPLGDDGAPAPARPGEGSPGKPS
ncbi:O-antigen ligase family protein [Streptomyces sp. NPDC088785]|uniref:O-antigen ligase family protein n=1 Tax=Streptomyces sp. NPDC088785 TaxID=3365897 RepID=UPI0038147FC9